MSVIPYSLFRKLRALPDDVGTLATDAEVASAVSGGGGGAAAVTVLSLRGIRDADAAHGAAGWLLSTDSFVFDETTKATYQTGPDPIGLIWPAPVFGSDYIGLPSGLYSISLNVSGFDGSTDHPLSQTEFKAFGIGLECGNLPANTLNLAGDDYVGDQTAYANVVLNSVLANDFGGLHVGPLVVDCRDDLSPLDPSLAGVYGFLRPKHWHVQPLSGRVPSEPLDGHSFNELRITIVKLG